MHHRFAATAILAALFSLTPSEGAAEGVTDPTLTSAPGGALVRRNRFLPWKPARAGHQLPADSELTCATGCTVRTYDGSTLTLDPEAHVAIGQLTFVLIDGSGFAALGRRFELRDGSVKAHVVVDKKRPRTLVIGTRNEGFIAVRPGDAQVAVRENRAGVASWQGGGVRVRRGKEVLDITAGQVASIGPDDEPLTARDFDPRPAWQASSGKLDEPQPLAVALGDRSGAVGLSWQPIANASGYRFELSREASFKKVFQTAKLGREQTSFVAKSLAKGTYFGRVTALDPHGLAGQPSEVALLRVVSLEAPSGGTIDPETNTIVAPPGTTLQLSETAHLEMAVDDHTFGPAKQELTIGEVPHTIRLRVEGDYGRQTRLQLEPRALKADVRLGPSNARWPDDAIDMTITIHDPSGRFDATTVEPAVDVLLGIEPVSVDWKREGTKLSARLPARTTTGPEVLRVIVHDQSGVLLGRNFLEIEPAGWASSQPDKALADVSSGSFATGSN